MEHRVLGPGEATDVEAHWQIRSHRVIGPGAVSDYVDDVVETPTDEVMHRQYLLHPGAVAVIALDDEDRIVVVRQYRHPVGFQLIEPPAGLLDADGESWLAAAQRELAEEAGLDPEGAPLSATAFAAAVRRRAAQGRPMVRLAAVFPFSSHHYLLRHWLASGGLDPDRDLRLVAVPPPRTARALAKGEVDGFLSGEPWGSHAAALGVGRVALTGGDIWPDHPEKVLAFRQGLPEEQAVAVTAAVIAAVLARQRRR